jgi:hypothetical protein
MQDTFYTRSGSSPTKPEWTGRCDRCGSWLRYAIPHTCRPGAERYWRALQAAWALITPSNDWRTYPTSRPIDGLPAPAPRLVIDLVSAPRSLRSESVSVESSAVTLLPLIQATSAQRAGEPMTLKPRSYPPNLSISALRRKYRCGVGLCTPAALSTQFHNLPWSYPVALEAPSNQEFWSRLLYFEKTALMALDTLSRSSKSPVSMTDAAQEQENPDQTLDACSKGSALAWKRERERMIAAQARRGSTSQEPRTGQQRQGDRRA